MALQSVWTEWGWKLMGEADLGEIPVGYTATPSSTGVVIRENAPIPPEILAQIANQPTITIEEWNRQAAIQNPIAYDLGQSLADTRAATPQAAESIIGAPAVLTPGKNGDIALLGGLGLLVYLMTGARGKSRRRAR
jgi:hypothetical protein